MSTKLSAVIITFNEEKNIQRCIEAALPVADEIIIVDSFSTDNTPEIVKKYPQVKFIQQSQKSFSAIFAAAFRHLADRARPRIRQPSSPWGAHLLHLHLQICHLPVSGRGNDHTRRTRGAGGARPARGRGAA